ncbi:MAG: glycosyltransferase family 2 protein [Anaerolineales bacterium]|nr:glycosyltransferase family 2 protein [Anaerolineales bacterium]
MKNGQFVDIVIPVYNEGGNIISTLKALEAEVSSPVRILICYDSDDDSTLEALKDFESRIEIVTVKNRGRYAHGAVMTGFRSSAAPAVISYMADDDYNAGIIDAMIREFHRGSEVVCASRFISGGSMTGCPWLKAVIVRLVSHTLHYLGGLPAHDATNAFRLFSRRLVNAVNVESTEGFVYSLELLAKCHRLGWKISEVPARWFERKEGKSRFKVFAWAPAYLRWYFYVFVTTYLRPNRV